MADRWRLVSRLTGQIDSSPGLIGAIETHLHSLKEVHGIALRSGAGAVLDEYELFTLKEWLGNSQAILALTSSLDLPEGWGLYDLEELMGQLEIGQEGNSFYLADQYSPELASLRRQQKEKQGRIAELRRQKQGEIALAVGRDFNYLGSLRISKLEQTLLSRLSERLDVLLAGESYTEVEFRLRETGEMMSLGTDIAALEDSISKEELRVRAKLSRLVGLFSRKIVANCRRLGKLDLVLAKARLARMTGGCIPQIVEGKTLCFKELVHPVIARELAREGTSFQPHDLELGRPPVTVITGANMGGKSVTLRAVGLAVAMAQYGLLPTAAAMSFSPRTFIYYSRQHESGWDGLSAFGTEIHSLAQALPRRREGGLYLLDEPARSTNPQEGSALVRAIIHWLQEGDSLTLLATHFPEVAALDGCKHLQVAGLGGLDPDLIGKKLALGPGELQKLMNYALISSPGSLPKEALKVAAYLGLDQEILAQASDLLKKKEVVT